MFDVNNAPVTRSELERFAHLVATSVDHLGIAPGEHDMAVAVADGADALLLPGGPATRDAVMAELDQLLAAPRRMAAMVSLLGWSPDATPTRPSWALVAVGRGGLPAVLCVRRLHEDDHWTLVDIRDAPWAVLSSASGLRAAIEEGRPLRLKVARSPELLQRPDEQPEPPLDERGEL
ncbi:hypothetical protein [Egicoccus sp. AB-alg2]|uniref:hypothetical protein n=1 Tax=Egicoccus sp. AB-alg2 TaxID=3242693 RepID=UPI00359E4D7F